MVTEVMNANAAVNPLEVLIGEQLSAVVFVQDYLQLDFDGQVLTCYRWPQVQAHEAVTEFGDPGYRDALCSLIARNVVKVDLEDDVELEVVFDEGARVSLSLSCGADGASEIATFRDIDGGWSFF